MKQKSLGSRKYLVEIKLGIFVISALVLFFITILSIREVPFLKGTYRLIVKFNFAEGLKSTSPVRFCGVDVGEIKKLEIKEEKGVPTVYIHIKIAKGIRIPKDSRFFINSLSLFGEKYLEIVPSQEASGSYIKEGAVVAGINPPPLFDVVTTVHEAMLQLDALIKEGEFKNSLEETFSNVNVISRELKNLILDIKNEEGTIGRLLYDDSLYEKSEEFIEDLKQNPWKLLYKPKEKRRRRK